MTRTEPGPAGRTSVPPARATMIACVCLLLLTACPNDTPPNRVASGEIRIEASEPGSLDPARADDLDEVMIVRNVFKGLIDYDPKTGALRPASATRWQVSSDARQFTFTLRRNNKFSNGETVTADSFVRAFNRVASKAQGSPLASQLSGVIGYEDYRAAKADTLAGVTALDEYRLQITLQAPDADFLARLVQPAFSPIPSEPALKTQKPSWSDHPIGNGPFMIENWSHNESVTLVPNPRWYGKAPQLARVDFVLLSDLELAYDEWQKGNLDWTRVPRAKENQALAQNPQRLIQKATSTLWYLVALTDLAPTRNLLLRQALSLAIDRRAISESLFAGLHPPATGIFPPGMPGYRNAAGGTGPCLYCAYDPGRARDLMKDGGVPKSTTIALAVPGGTFAEEWADRLVLEIQRTLGIHIEIVTKKPLSDFRAYLTGARSGVIGALSLTMTYPTPDSFLRPLFSRDGAVNFSRWSNPTFEGFIAQAHTQRNDGERNQLYRRAEDVLVTQLPIIPLWWEGELRLVNLPRFTNLEMDAFGYPTLETAAPKKATAG